MTPALADVLLAMVDTVRVRCSTDRAPPAATTTPTVDVDACRRASQAVLDG